VLLKSLLRDQVTRPLQASCIFKISHANTRLALCAALGVILVVCRILLAPCVSRPDITDYEIDAMRIAIIPGTVVRPSSDETFLSNGMV